MSDSDIYNNLLRPLDDISFSERWKRMLSLGQQCVKSTTASGDATPLGGLSNDGLRAALTSLATSDEHYKRMLAAMSLRGMVCEYLKQNQQAPPDVLEALRKLMLDRSSKIFKLVATRLAQISTDNTLKEILAEAPTAQFDALSKAIVKCGKLHVMHDLHEEQKKIECTTKNGTNGNNSTEAVTPHKLTSIKKIKKLCVFFSQDELKSLTASDLSFLPNDVFRRLTIRNPETMAETLIGLKAGLSNEKSGPEDADSGKSVKQEDSLRTLIDSKTFLAASVLGLCGTKEVDLGMKLLKDGLRTSNRFHAEATDAIKIYLRVRTVELAKYMLQCNDWLRLYRFTITSKRAIKRLQNNIPLLVQLYKMNRVRIDVFPILLKPQRQTFYDAIKQDLYTGENKNVMPMDVAMHIPNQGVRENIAIKMFHLKELQDSPDTRIEYLSLVSFPQAQKQLKRFITDPDVELRCTCARALIRAVAYYPGHMTDVLQFIVQRINEQNSWHQNTLRCLGELPQYLWKAEHLSYVDKLIQANFDAKDASEYAQRLAHTLVLRIAKSFPEYAAKWTLKFMKYSIFSVEGLSQLSYASLEKFMAILFPEIKKKILAKDFTFLSHIKFEFRSTQRVFRNILKPFFDCQLSIDETLEDDSALEFYYNAFRRETIQETVPNILRTRDMVFNKIVGQVLAKHLQGKPLNLWLQSLSVYDGEPVEFEIRLSKIIEFFNPAWVHRLSSTQQHDLTRILSNMFSKIDNPMFITHEYFNYVARIPSNTIDDGLRSYVSEAQENIFFRDAAVFALRHLNDVASMEELKVAIQDSRERYAVMALCCRLKLYPVRFSLETLSSVLRTCKLVSSKKHLVRFVGRLADEEALELLKHYCKETEDIHPDIRLAIQQAFRNHLDRKEVWDFYANECKSPRPAQCIEVLSISDDSLYYSWQQERMNEFILTLLQNEDATVELETLKRLANSEILGDRAILEKVLSFLSHTELNRMRLTLKHVLKSDHISVEEIVELLSNLPDDRDLDAAVDMVISECSCELSSSGNSRSERTINGLYERLVIKQRQPTIMCKLILNGDLDLLESRLMEMLDNNLLHAGAAAYVVGKLSRLAMSESLEINQACEENFRQHKQPFLRRCGLVVLESVGAKMNWPLECRKALELYCKDSDLWVRSDAALITLPTLENESSSDSD